MTDIKWGPAIAVDGKRPGWLGDAEFLPYLCEGKITDQVWRANDPTKKWDRIKTIHVRADHPHYRQTEAAPIDWSGELEAVHEDGRVVPVTLHSDDGGKILPMRIDRELSDGVDDCIEYFDRDGSCNVGGWRIRNVPQPTPQADTKPDLTAELEDLGQQLAALSERHEALAERVARMPQPATIRTMDLRLDPDLIEARKLVAERTGRLQIECGYSRSVLDGEQDDHPAVINTLAAIKRGRALALAGEKE